MRTMELLAPACSYEGMLGAINAGADAVYVGGSLYSARAYAENPNTEELLSGMDYAHLHEKKVYLTLNTLIKERELSTLYSYLKPLYENGLDGVIFQDFGVMLFLKKQFPKLALHASTQISITDTGGLNWLQKQGCSRVVLARELSLQEISAIHKESPLELEVFIHGALCYSYSGQCLFSSLLGGRSGNRGRCAQPCRLPYSYVSETHKKPGKEEYLLSPKDLCGIDFLPDLYAAGVTSLKIEGRMKRAEYAAGIVEVYKRALDSLYEGKFYVSKEDRSQLMDLYSRSGNSTGYFKRRNGREMMAFSSPGYRMGDDALFKRLHETYIKKGPNLSIQGTCQIAAGKPVCLTFSFKNIKVDVNGPIPETAKNKPLETEELARRLKKTGDTEFVFDDLKIHMEQGLFLPVQNINALRRKGLAALKEALLMEKRRIPEKELTINEIKTPHNLKKDTAAKTKTGYSVLITSISQGRVLLDFPEITEVTIDADCVFTDKKAYQALVSELTYSGVSVHLAMPFVFRRSTKHMFEENFSAIFLPEIRGFLIRNLESLEFLKMSGFSADTYTFRSDSMLYSYNSLAQEIILKNGFSRLTLPVELNKQELSQLLSVPAEWVVYSHLPFMVTAGCLKTHKESCSAKPELLQLIDRYKKKFPVKNHCSFCYNTIHNGEPMILWDKIFDLKRPDRLHMLRLDFHIEEPLKTREILQNFLKKAAPSGCFTRGHFNRGVE